MGEPVRCIFPCMETFSSEANLRRHFQNVPSCKKQWADLITATQRLEFERASELKRAATREVATGLGGDATPDSEMGTHDANYEEVNDYQAEHNESELEGDTGPDASDYHVRTAGFDDVDQGGDVFGPEPAELLFEEYLFGGGFPATSGEEHINPCLAEEGNLEEEDDTLFPLGDVVEELGDAIEDVHLHSEDEDDDPSEIEVFTRAGEVKKHEKTQFSELLDGGSPFHPFRDAAEFELVKWLNELPLSKVDSFIQQDWVQRNGGLSFGSGKGMRERIEKLAKPRMPWMNVEVTPRSGTPSSPVYLCYRDPVEAIRSLLDRPSLAKHMSYTPERHWRDKLKGTRRYSEIFTGDWAWEMQEVLPLGSTLVPVLLGSDKAHLTDHSGDKSAWPLYLSIGNIHSGVRNKPSAKCWILIAYIPIALFTNRKDTHTALQARLFHQCLKIILASLKKVAEEGGYFKDSRGDERLCYTYIAAYLADYPEQVLINVSSSMSSPVTTAGYEGLGDATPHPRRTREWILGRIAQLRQQVDANDVSAYKDAAKELGLNAVDQPFWEDFPRYQPDLVICPDILHGLLRMWRDHILKWVQHLVGEQELDARIQTLQPLTGMRHFANGISHLSQWSGREDRELQRVLLAAIAGAPRIDAPAMRCLRAFHDFLYLAQYRSHTTTTLGYLDQSLKVFHSLKRTFITNGARRGKKKVIPHFCIPKLAGLHMYVYHIPRMGSSVQFSTEITETCHQMMAKAPYKATNGRDFFAQMCFYMNRKATLALAEELGLSWFQQAPQETDDYEYFARMVAMESKKLDKQTLKQKTRAENGYVWLTRDADKRRVPLNNLLQFYRLGISEFHNSLKDFIEHYCPDEPVVSTGLDADAWYRCRLQHLTVQDEEELADMRTIQAVPPGATKSEHGYCNCALVKASSDAESTGIGGYRIAQVRLIFQLRLPKGHTLHQSPLAFVYWFSTPLDRAEKDINMYKVQYNRRMNNQRIGGVVKLSNLRRLVQLVPAYGAKVNTDLSSLNSMDVWKRYYINSFMDKETYQAVW